MEVTRYKTSYIKSVAFYLLFRDCVVTSRLLHTAPDQSCHQGKGSGNFGCTAHLRTSFNHQSFHPTLVSSIIGQSWRASCCQRGIWDNSVCSIIYTPFATPHGHRKLRKLQFFDFRPQRDPSLTDALNDVPLLKASFRKLP